jgi:hypothetical protein
MVGGEFSPVRYVYDWTTIDFGSDIVEGMANTNNLQALWLRVWRELRSLE